MGNRRETLGLTAERFSQLLYRDPESEFGWRWRPRPLSDPSFNGNERSWAAWNSKFADKPAGFWREDGAAAVRIGDKVYRYHLLMEAFGPDIGTSSLTFRKRRRAARGAACVGRAGRGAARRRPRREPQL
jgi:hypothetical protein